LRGWFGPQRAARRLALLGTLALSFVAIPAAWLTGAAVPMVVVGWEGMLSAYSYVVDSPSATATVQASLFFVLVNPTVVYADRGAQIGDPRLDIAALFRMLTGVLTMLGRNAVLAVVATTAWFSSVDLADVITVRTYVQFCSTQLVLLLGLYCAHSGLASVQIGWMRLLGHQVPERYVYPFLSRTPLEFWARWNTWIGRWAHRYLYFRHSDRLSGCA
jgi:hypothetical protein